MQRRSSWVSWLPGVPVGDLPDRSSIIVRSARAAGMALCAAVASMPAAAEEAACADCPVLVEIPTGSFQMGRTVNYGYGDMDGPTHTVTIERPFALAQNEVTRGEYRRFIRETGYVPARRCNVYGAEASWFIDPSRSWEEPGFAQEQTHPVVCVSWRDTQAYIEWLNGKTGRQYRLPSEAEWEYVALLADLGESRNGGGVTHENANIGRAECCGGETGGRDVWLHTAPVGSFPADRLGLHDIRGNVWEWQADCYHEDYSGAPDDGGVRVSCPSAGYHVVRGASYGDGGAYLSERMRLRGTKDEGYFTLGFRLAESLDPAAARVPVESKSDITHPVAGRMQALREREAGEVAFCLARSTDPEILSYWGEKVAGRRDLIEWHCEWFAEKGWTQTLLEGPQE